MDKIIQLTEDTIIPFGTLDKVYPVTIGKAVTLANGENLETSLANINKNKVSTKQIDIWNTSLQEAGQIWGTTNALNISANGTKELKLSASGMDIEVTDSNHTLTITGKTDFKNDVHVDGSLFVEQGTHFGNLVDIQGSVEMLNNLTVNKDIRTFKTLKSSNLEVINDTTTFKVTDSDVTYKRGGTTQFELKENGIKARIDSNLNAALDATNNRINLVAPEVRWVLKKLGRAIDTITTTLTGTATISDEGFQTLCNVYNTINTTGKVSPEVIFKSNTTGTTPKWGIRVKNASKMFIPITTHSAAISLDQDKEYELISLSSEEALTGTIELIHTDYIDDVHLGSEVLTSIDNKQPKVTSIYNSEEGGLILENTTDTTGKIILGEDSGSGGAGIYGETIGAVEFKVKDSNSQVLHTLRFDPISGLTFDNEDTYITDLTLGQISSLATTNKNTIVAAINELVSRVAALELK